MTLLRFLMALLLPLSFSVASAQSLLPCHVETGNGLCCSSTVCDHSSAVDMAACTDMCMPNIAALPAFAIMGHASAILIETATAMVGKSQEVKPPVPPPRVS
jgi:hypothetical protein